MLRRSKVLISTLGLTLGLGLGVWAWASGKSSVSGSGMQRSGVPNAKILWAWERPERLGFLPPEAEVALLVGTVRLAGEDLMRSPRLQPLEVPAKTRLQAVVRLESDPERRPSLDVAQRHDLVETLLAWTLAPPGFAGLQIDFDATMSERPFYRQLLVELRERLPGGMPLSITALASWCLGDPWLAELPIDEAVPMLFRMGTDDAAVRRALAHGEEFRDPRCRTSYGLSSDEPWPELRGDRRLYLFHPKAWSEAAFLNLERRWRAADETRGDAS